MERADIWGKSVKFVFIGLLGAFVSLSVFAMDAGSVLSIMVCLYPIAMAFIFGMLFNAGYWFLLAGLIPLVMSLFFAIVMSFFTGEATVGLSWVFSFFLLPATILFESFPMRMIFAVIWFLCAGFGGKLLGKKLGA